MNDLPNAHARAATTDETRVPSPLSLLFGPYGRVCFNSGDFEFLLQQLAWLGRRCKHAIELELPNTLVVRAAMASGLDLGALCLAAFTEGMRPEAKMDKKAG